MSTLLQIEGMRLQLGEFRLGPLSLTMQPGDYLVLLGPSGCGKTSLLRAVAGIYDVAPGQLRLENRDVGALAPHRRRIGYVAQSVDLFPHMNVAQNVGFGLRYVDAPPDERRRTFDRVTGLLGLKALLHRYPGTLSGGESKRVALARCLVIDPRILLLDEPLGMLDYNARSGMLDVLKNIHRELGTATIHVTHDREEAWVLGGRCVIMREGVFEQSGDAATLFRRPRSRFVAEFLGGTNLFPARFESCADGTRAVLDWGEFILATPVRCAAGYLQIRPETLVPADGPGRNRIAGVIRSIADRGLYTELEITIGSGREFPAAAPPDGAVAGQTGGPPGLCVRLPGNHNAGLHVGAALCLECRSEPHPIPEHS